MAKEEEKKESQDLGKIEKPEAEKFQKGRRLIFAPLLFAPYDDDPEFQKLHNKYWQQVKEQIENLEGKLTGVSRIYHEYICTEGGEGVDEIKRMDAGSYDIIKGLVEKGAELMAAENSELLSEFMDWNKCLSVRLSSQKAATKIYGFYEESLKSREDWIEKAVDLTLGEDEFGLLIMRENNKIQFPSNVEVFYVAPPSLDEIKRWVRDKNEAELAAEEAEEVEKKEQQPADKETEEKE